MSQHPHYTRVPPLMPTPQSGIMNDPRPHHHHGAPPLMPTPHALHHTLLQTPGNLPNIPPPYNPPHLLPQPTGILNPPHLPYNGGFGYPPRRGNPGNYNPGRFGYNPPQPQGGPAPYVIPQKRRGQGRYFNEGRNYQRGGRYQKYDGSGQGRWGGASNTNSDQYYNRSMFEDPWAELMKSACAAGKMDEPGSTTQPVCTSTIDSVGTCEGDTIQNIDCTVDTNTEVKVEDNGQIVASCEEN